MGVKDRSARQKTFLRQQILDAARELLVRDGYEKLSMRRVAERIDYSPTAIYLHFKDKQELVSSLCDETFARLIRELETLPDECPDPVARLRKGMERYIAFGLKHPDHYLPAFVLPVPAHLDPKRKDDAMSSESSGMRAFAFLRECIADGVKARLNNLGFNIDDDEKTKRAVKAYQKVYLKQDNGSGIAKDILDDIKTRHDKAP